MGQAVPESIQGVADAMAGKGVYGHGDGPLIFGFGKMIGGKPDASVLVDPLGFVNRL